MTKIAVKEQTGLGVGIGLAVFYSVAVIGAIVWSVIGVTTENPSSCKAIADVSVNDRDLSLADLTATVANAKSPVTTSLLMQRKIALLNAMEHDQSAARASVLPSDRRAALDKLHEGCIEHATTVRGVLSKGASSSLVIDVAGITKQIFVANPHTGSVRIGKSVVVTGYELDNTILADRIITAE